MSQPDTSLVSWAAVLSASIALLFCIAAATAGALGEYLVAAVLSVPFVIAALGAAILNHRKATLLRKQELQESQVTE